ncbi:DNA repair protein RecO [Tropicimonas sp. IMCC6043]|uniref:DNA repair protein RecO n=1 Tax=Tropicimonas sp. IMCC6043 TaxID=2510645 RepID=UPI00101B6665|nr:DNA repair protein RecO [Tropicimonas sp. IMCC6043]RYH08324.1 DNA repair protein RecO [Tropicimonas sp. IMCC6043]
MDWRDEGALLSVRPHGESSAIIEVFTARHGRHAGIVRGGTSRRIAPILQPGAQLGVEWRARLEAHLGSFRVEPLKSRAAAVMGERRALYGLGAACALLSFALPERETHPGLYVATQHLFDALGTDPRWPALYLLWEKALLEELGFALDLGQCAATGATADLAYVSPKTGRAVSRAGAGAWADRLLPLPPVLQGAPDATLRDILDGLRTTGYFLETWLAPALGDRSVPAARDRFVSLLGREERET